MGRVAGHGLASGPPRPPGGELGNWTAGAGCPRLRPEPAPASQVQGGFGRAAVSSGASTSTKEEVELRDGDATRYLGRGGLGKCVRPHPPGRPHS
ncbi:hypothetical protein [Pseudoxanthomonas suwonensis]|uniref:hypothetical protein n=1 Tax=Pseudoxanthomonas suwonensis TaxID=314722 RepID=UPI002D218987|nr:hypothetical protein [Pseudoxanthomonas suwonensis]